MHTENRQPPRICILQLRIQMPNWCRIGKVVFFLHFFEKNIPRAESRVFLVVRLKYCASDFEEVFLKCEELKWSLECWNGSGRQLGGLGGKAMKALR